MAARERRYLSFLLRLWQVRQNGDETWRASLENPRTGERRGFANIRDLNKFLLQQTQSGEEEKEKQPDN
jgi:hypothetical protein